MNKLYFSAKRKSDLDELESFVLS